MVDAACFMRHRKKLLRDYAGRVIAIRNEEVVADAQDYFTLYWQLCEIYGEPVYAYVRKVCPESFMDMGSEPVYLVL